MSRYDKIPKLEVDWKKPYPEIAGSLMDSYFKTRRHCSDEIFRGEMWRGVAILGWTIAAAAVSILILRNLAGC